MSSRLDYFLSLCSLWCEQQISEDQVCELQKLIVSDPAMQVVFVEYIQLHGQLTRDAGGARFELNDQPPATPVTICRPASQQRAGRFRFTPRMVAVAASLTLLVAFMAFREHESTDRSFSGIAKNGSGAASAEAVVAVSPPLESVEFQQSNTEPADSEPLTMPEFVELSTAVSSTDVVSDVSDVTENSIPETASVKTVSIDDASVVAEIDRLITAAWTDNNVIAADVADDHEWVRRCYLTLVGRIPTVTEAFMFVHSVSPRKRADLIDSLLTDPRFVENLSVTWLNLLIGRSNSRNVDAESLFGFLNEQFLQNRPWMDTVGRLIAAEGRSDQNGATNFLLAHLNDQATPATAVTARLFLGQQVQCTQCHNHPFDKDRQQHEFWALNAFFKQAERASLTSADGSLANVWTLKDSGAQGMTFYETLRGQQKATLPEFAGHAMTPEDTQPRRAELVKLLAADDRLLVAQAMVNRTWAQVFGFGFTNPIDDIGPHNPVSHPELLKFLTRSFVESNYDVQRLIRWMVLSQTFQRSSVQDETSMAGDAPEDGGTPLFSRTYPRPMAPEQVYDSIRIAIRSAAGQPIDSSLGTAHRREWVEQFVQSYGTDENDEQLAFEGNIAQAMLLMNGEDIQAAIPLTAAEVTRSVQESPEALNKSLERIAMATLNRQPSAQEEKIFRSRFRILSRSYPADQAIRTVTEDMLWAYLNSTEFTSVH